MGSWVCHLKPLSSMISPHRPARMIRLRSSRFDRQFWLHSWSFAGQVTWSMLIVRPWGSRQVIRLKPTFKKNPAPGKAVSYTPIYLNAQFHVKKAMLTIKPALVIWIVIGSVSLTHQYVGLRLKSTDNPPFSFDMRRKSNILSSK